MEARRVGASLSEDKMFAPGMTVSNVQLKTKGLEEQRQLDNECSSSPGLAVREADNHTGTTSARKLDTCAVELVRALQGGNYVLQEIVLEQGRSIRTQRGALERAEPNEELLREARERERLLYEQLQQIQCQYEVLKKENQTLKHALMNTAQESVDKDDTILRDRKEYDALRTEVKNATRNAQDARYLAQMERERRIAQVTQLKSQLEKWKRHLCHQHTLVDTKQYGICTSVIPEILDALIQGC
ncbi:hypothetical protein EAH_00007020 [Eimeria acervulina]|uniref:Uncharacterized protein n=1 Tax=Eimeria acervulina TaxID=5801 RepID=U6GDG6_EIMAC|nr:hypothetical protein EAH_00007020 [Eimeria acervulina]CDI78311.1 hypothetical protein EAH_00007020 [Eimeria acervulina]